MPSSKICNFVPKSLASHAGVLRGAPGRLDGRNIVGQQLPTLLDVTCCVRLHTLLHVVAQSLKPVKLFSQQLPTFLLFRDRRSVAQQCWIRLHSSPTLLEPRTRITHCLQWLMGCILPTMHYRSQHCWEVLHPLAHHCQHERNNVGSCYVTLHAALEVENNVTTV